MLLPTEPTSERKKRKKKQKEQLEHHELCMKPSNYVFATSGSLKYCSTGIKIKTIRNKIQKAQLLTALNKKSGVKIQHQFVGRFPNRWNHYIHGICGIILVLYFTYIHT